MKESEQDFSLKSFYTPLTTLKAVHILVIVGFIVFFNMLFNGFVSDDKAFITENPEAHSLHIEKIFGVSSFNDNYYRPIEGLYYTLSYLLFKDVSFFYHFIQLIVHFVNTSLLFLFFIKFFNKKLALFLSLLFLIHPIQVESVSLIAATPAPMSFLFGMTALLLSLKDTLNLRRLSLISGLLLLSILTKETGFLFVFMALLLSVSFKKRHTVALLVSGCITGICYFLIRFGIGHVYHARFKIVPIATLTLPQRLMNIPAIMFYYLKRFFFPTHLVFDQQWIVTTIDFYHFYFPLLVDLLYLLLVVFLWKYAGRVSKKVSGTFLFFFLWLVSGLLPLLQIYPLDMTVSDRWFYFPIVGMLGMLGAGLNLIVIHEKAKNATLVVGAILLLLLSFRTVVRNTNFYDELTFYSHDTQLQDNYELENDLGVVLLAKSDAQAALIHQQKSVQLHPYPTNLYNLGLNYEVSGNLQKAKEYYYKAFDMMTYSTLPYKHDIKIYASLAWVLELLGEYKPAEKIIEAGFQYYPETNIYSSILWEELAVIKYRQHDQEDALIAAQKAVNIYPSDLNNAFYNNIKNKQDLPLDLNLVDVTPLN